MKPRPIIRLDATYDLKSAVEKIANETGLFRTCLSCENFNEPEEFCRLYKQRPPARVMVYGCPSWMDANEVPF